MHNTSSSKTCSMAAQYHKKLFGSLLQTSRVVSRISFPPSIHDIQAKRERKVAENTAECVKLPNFP